MCSQREMHCESTQAQVCLVCDDEQWLSLPLHLMSEGLEASDEIGVALATRVPSEMGWDDATHVGSSKSDVI